MLLTVLFALILVDPSGGLLGIKGGVIGIVALIVAKEILAALSAQQVIFSGNFAVNEYSWHSLPCDNYVTRRQFANNVFLIVTIIWRLFSV